MKLMNIADEGAGYKAQLYELYDNAFPEQEKKPLHVMEQLVDDGKMEMLAMVDGDEFVGLAINMISGDRALLDYYAIAPEKRGWKSFLRILRTRNISLRSRHRMRKRKMQRSVDGEKLFT